MLGPAPLRLHLDNDTLVANWRWLAGRNAAAECGAAVKADGYGLGAREVVARLAAAGCRDFFTATWAEAAALGALPEGARLAVLHGVRSEDMVDSLASAARPVLNSVEQVARWRDAGGGVCDVMVDTGMNRLGLTIEQAMGGALDGLEVDTLMSHLACADEPDHPLNARQRDAFRALCDAVAARRYSLANSAGILLGQDYAFDLTRPGIALYGGVPVPAATGIRAVAAIEAQILQVRSVGAGAYVGYGATWQAPDDARIAILNLGYADGYMRLFAPGAYAMAGDRRVPVVGRISMDLIAVDVTNVAVGEGDWLGLDFDLQTLSARSGLSQYELLTGLNNRFERRWI
ncbi:MAG TPA: alanine racemase [Sphingomonas sp.]|uniref:alanine racemase n=1 Tax=Sphingomonas sp. TaxID=28214 RepID=UPI002C289558|nr:alanine racemase [Sphingomonas sp.]HMI18471.1 alanine racemase [Sphingomonas sp.]